MSSPIVPTRRETCRSRWAAEKNSRMADLRKLWRAYCDGKEEVADLGSIYEYGLSFDYVAPDTFNDQREGYWRWQFSWGGPSDEVRFYADCHDAREPYRTTYTFLDWFDGYERRLRGRDEALLSELWSWFQELGATEKAYRKARCLMPGGCDA